jgi:hypothetical protein
MEQHPELRSRDGGSQRARRGARTALVLALMAVGVAILLAAGTATAQRTGMAMASEAALPDGAGDTMAGGDLGIHATLRISIPFGFDQPLPVFAGGREVLARGGGGCTADQLVTVVITVTQSASGAIATGESVHTCTGQLQPWSSVVTAGTVNSFVAGEAEACGNATTHEAGYVTDAFEWCANVGLSVVDQPLYLPLVVSF